MQIESKHLHMIQRILEKYPFTFYVFGSRSLGTPRKLSDLDLCFFEEIPFGLQVELDDDFDASDLPYKVDIVNWNQCTDAFKENIQKDLQLIQIGKRKLKLF